MEENNNGLITEAAIETASYTDVNIENSDKFFSFSRMMKDAGVQALKSAKWFAIILCLFSITNIIFCIASIFSNSAKSGLYIFITFIIATLSITFSMYMTYRYIVVDALRVVYGYLTPIFKKICTKIIDVIIAGGNKLTKKDIEKEINAKSIMLEVYGKKAPKYVQKGLMLVLNKIPFSTFLVDMHEEIMEKKDGVRLSEILYKKMDTYIIDSIFNVNTMKWALWLIIINVAFQFAVIYYFR
ncbi:MAG TPA: hypothetical protein DIT04_05645 [Dysgonomonas sp.]|nr:hypothetical protein [Dysgonomonas sp.]